MHYIYRVAKLPNRQPIPITKVEDRIGETFIELPSEKVVAVVETNAPDRNAPFRAPDEVSEKIAQNFIHFLEGEVEAGRLESCGFCIQCGGGTAHRVVMSGLLVSRDYITKTYH